MGVGTKEFFKMMEQGQIITSEFLPKFNKELRTAVREGGALGASLNTSRVAMNRFGTAFKLNILDSFEAGADTGLGTFFNELTYTVKEASPIFKMFGVIFGGVMASFGTAIHVVYQFIRPFVELVYNIGKMTSEVGALNRIMHLFIGLLLLVPGILQWVNNKVEDINPILKTFVYLIEAVTIGLIAWGTKGRLLKIFFAILTGGLSKIIPMLWGFITTMRSGATASALLASSAGAAGNTIWAIFSRLATHPIFMLVTGLGLAIEQISKLNADPAFNAAVAKSNAKSAQDGNLTWLERAGNYIMNAQAATWATTGEMLGNALGMNPNTKVVNNEINVTASSPQEFWEKVGPLVTGAIDEANNNTFTTAMNPAGG